jgi:hypothetical protein
MLVIVGLRRLALATLCAVALLSAMICVLF